VLAQANNLLAVRGSWVVHKAVRVGTRMPYSGRMRWEPVDGDAVQLACRQCPHRPRVKLRDLYRAAGQAVDEDKREIYR
jgi:hypothetical protein